MPIRLDDEWHFEGTTSSRERRVYRDALLIGRVRRWRTTEEGDAVTREWFTAERWENQAFVPMEGELPDFEEAVRVFYDVMN